VVPRKREGGRFNIGADLSPGAFTPFPARYIAANYEAAFRQRFAAKAREIIWRPGSQSLLARRARLAPPSPSRRGRRHRGWLTLEHRAQAIAYAVRKRTGIWVTARFKKRATGSQFT
jgi:hypothetical protein